MDTSRYIVMAAVAAASLPAWARDYSVKSPDGRIDVTLAVNGDVRWSVTADGKDMLAPSRIDMTVDGRTLGENPKVKKVATTAVNAKIATPVFKRAEVDDVYNQLTLTMAGGYAIEVRAYNDGAAYRFVLDRKGRVTVDGETAQFNFPTDGKAWVPYVNDNRGGEKYTFSFESYYDEQPLSGMYPDSLAITPLLVDIDGYKVAVSDFGALDYPGMFLKSSGDNGLVAEFAPVPLEGELGGHNFLNFIPTERAAYIATDVEGRRAFPWRALVIAREDRELPGSDMSVRLSQQPAKGEDFSWVKPGKVAWDWWNNLHLYGVDFKVGRDNPTYNYYIDFAADNGLEYIIVDEGWSDENSILKTRGNIDIQELVDYGRDKGVGVILWASWKNVHRELDEAMKKYADMGVAGFKIDFFDADDQNMMRDMEKFARAAADNHLLLDYHGMKANGMQVKYPNIVNFEGVKGLENYRWSSVENNPPRYAVTAPFIRTLTGPMDYTPGAMSNMNMAEHRADDANPKSEGTRAQQLAMYVVYDAPLQMLADSPSRYKDNQHCTDFIAAIPTVFDQTEVLDGKVGEYIVMARRAGDVWYLGAMTDRTPRSLPVSLSFLPEGTYEMTYVADGVNCDIDATDHVHASRTVTNADVLPAELFNAGGFAAVIRPLR